uniref:Uncharacterized protein n=1 Tax=Oryza sativa subsp. japonica TaxID=39947 RepID=Q6K3N6_ORYSJ|nr:hypothetical protein [Oryza sativa Japonica Group]
MAMESPRRRKDCVSGPPLQSTPRKTYPKNGPFWGARVDDGASHSGAVPLPTWRGDAEELTGINYVKNKLKRTKYVACGIFQSFTEKLLSSKTQSCKRNLEFLISPNPAKRGRIRCNIFCRCPCIYYLPDSESKNRNGGGGASMAGALLLPRRFACATVARGRRQPLWRRPVG